MCLNCGEPFLCVVPKVNFEDNETTLHKGCGAGVVWMHNFGGKSAPAFCSLMEYVCLV